MCPGPISPLRCDGSVAPRHDVQSGLRRSTTMEVLVARLVWTTVEGRGMRGESEPKGQVVTYPRTLRPY